MFFLKLAPSRYDFGPMTLPNIYWLITKNCIRYPGRLRSTHDIIVHLIWKEATLSAGEMFVSAKGTFRQLAWKNWPQLSYPSQSSPSSSLQILQTAVFLLQLNKMIQLVDESFAAFEKQYCLIPSKLTHQVHRNRSQIWQTLFSLFPFARCNFHWHLTPHTNTEQTENKQTKHFITFETRM